MRAIAPLSLALLLGCSSAAGEPASPKPSGRAKSGVRGLVLDDDPGDDGRDGSFTCPADMAYLPGGRFQMGSSEADDESPAHEVTLSPLCLDLDEVTVAEYRRCEQAGECPRHGPEPPVRGGICYGSDRVAPDLPRGCVSPRQALAFCAWQGRRLPTEAEWEYAARGGWRQWRYPTGNTAPTPQTSCIDRREQGPCRPRSFPPEAFGLHDLAGNLSEWVADGFVPYDAAPQLNPLQIGDDSHVCVRGASYRDERPHRSSRREPAPRDAFPMVGFRCVWSP